MEILGFDTVILRLTNNDWICISNQDKASYDLRKLKQDNPVQKFRTRYKNANLILSVQKGNFVLETEFDDEPGVIYSVPEELLKEETVNRALQDLYKALSLKEKRRVYSKIYDLFSE